MTTKKVHKLPASPPYARGAGDSLAINKSVPHPENGSDGPLRKISANQAEKYYSTSTNARRAPFRLLAFVPD